MKKIVKISLILLIAMCIIGNVYAALSCNVSIKTSKAELNKNDEFTVDVNISNIQSDRGIISLGATLEYDKDSLTLVKMEGKNGWETPSSGVSYNESNGKIAITKSGLGKNDETVFTITFKVKENSKQNLEIVLKDITVADGTALAKISQTHTNITIKEETQNNTPQPGDNGQDTNTDTNQIPSTDTNTNVNPNNNTTTNSNVSSTNNNKTTNTSVSTSTNSSSKNVSFPKAGSYNIIFVVFIVFIVLIVLVATLFFIKIKLINKKIDE